MPIQRMKYHFLSIQRNSRDLSKKSHYLLSEWFLKMSFFLFFFPFFLLYLPPNRLTAPFYATCLLRCITKLNVKGHRFLSFTIQCFIGDRANDTRLLQLWCLRCIRLHSIRLSLGQSLTRIHHKKKAMHCEMRKKGVVTNSLAVIPDDWGRQNKRGGVTFCCMVEQLLAT